jgi:hypothetical protein
MARGVPRSRETRPILWPARRGGQARPHAPRDPAGGTPEEFAALIKADTDKWGGIGKRLGVKLD